MSDQLPPREQSDIDAMICRWAEAKYGLKNVVRVEFEPDTHGPYSDVTPDLDPYLEIAVWVDGEVRPHCFEAQPYATDLIRDILRFGTHR